MIHSCLAFVATPGNEGFVHNPVYAFSLWGQLGVVVFFVISGYCVAGAAYGTMAAGRTTATFVYDRIRRIYPPYWAAGLFSVALGWLIAMMQKLHLVPPATHQAAAGGGQPGLIFWLTNLLLVHSEFGQPPLLLISWSLCYEVFFYAILAVLLLAALGTARRKSGAGGLLIFQIGIFALTMISLIWLNFQPSTCPFPLDRWFLFGLGALFFLMSAAEPGAAARGASVQFGLAAALTLALAYESTGPAFLDLSHPSTCIQAAAALIFLALLYLLRPMDARVAHLPIMKPLLWLGTISYSLYLVHLFVLAIPDVLGRRLGFNGGRYWITYLVEIAVAIFAGWLFHILVERHFISSRQKRRAREELASEPVTVGVAAAEPGSS